MEWENQLIQELQWSNKISNKASKELVAQEIAGLAKDGDVIGAGSGSTVYLTLFALAQRVKQESLHIEIIPASAEISMHVYSLACRKLLCGISVRIGHSTVQTKWIRIITSSKDVVEPCLRRSS